MTDESAKGEKNQRDKFCLVNTAEPLSAHTSLLQIYTRGPELWGECSLVAWPEVCTKGTNQSSLQVWQGAGMFTVDNGKAFLLTYCHRSALFLFLQVPTAPISSRPWGSFLEGYTRTGAHVRPIRHVTSSGSGTRWARAVLVPELHFGGHWPASLGWAISWSLQLLLCSLETVVALQPTYNSSTIALTCEVIS